MMYSYTKDSERQPGVPRGTIIQHHFKSEIFAGTQRDYWLYVPAQYRAEAPTALR